MQLPFAFQIARTDGKHIDLGIDEAPIGILRGAHHRFPAHIERSVDEHRATGLRLESLQQGVKLWVTLRIYCLDPRRTIHMGHRW